MDKDREYLEELLSPLRITLNYRPKLGSGSHNGISPDEFRQIYSTDAFYHWLGLDLPEIYVAHRVAGGITSLYRQIGIGCERLIRKIFQDVLRLSESDLSWNYAISERGKQRTIHLDARIPLSSLADVATKQRLTNWVEAQCERMSVPREPSGIVFEVRQGYKSKDSKRQNADLLSASRAYQSGYLPCMLVLSQQIDMDIKTRYQNAGWIVLTGDLVQDENHSTYAFMKRVVGYDLAAFLERNHQSLREQVYQLVRLLLRVEESEEDAS